MQLAIVYALNFLVFLSKVEKGKIQCPEAATGGVLCKKMLLKISQNSQENTCDRVSF